ncbi:MAG: hypothetical protein GYB32_12260 [Algicola sp.]|nr:hypothetical protein [Algicola sp.]
MSRKRLLLISFLILYTKLSFACPVCDKNQPAVTRGWTHGIGPSGMVDWVIISVMVAITIFILLVSVKALVNPKENDKHHIKNSILDKHEYQIK